MKKIIVQILLFVIIFNSIFNSFLGCKVEAAIPGQSTPDPDLTITKEDVDQVDQQGTANYQTGGTTNSSSVDGADTQSTTVSIMGVLMSLVTYIPGIIMELVDYLVSGYGYVDTTANTPDDIFTIQNIVFGNYYMLNANMFKDSTTASVSDVAGGASGFNAGPIDTIKESVARWYYILKLISLALGLLTLIYIGIRMALSTLASDQAKYKKMLVAWVQSIGIILMLPFIMRGLNYLNEVLLELAITIRGLLSQGGQVSFELDILKNISKKVSDCGGTQLVAYSISYIFLLFAQFKFFMMYMRRFFAVGFLTVISPLISITYSIDKAGDGKAQAFESWLKEYAVNMLIQPLQAFIYLVFAFSASEIAKASPILGIIFLLSLTRAEKIVKTIFDLRGLASIHTMKIFNKGK